MSDTERVSAADQNPPGAGAGSPDSADAPDEGVVADPSGTEAGASPGPPVTAPSPLASAPPPPPRPTSAAATTASSGTVETSIPAVDAAASPADGTEVPADASDGPADATSGGVVVGAGGSEGAMSVGAPAAPFTPGDAASDSPLPFETLSPSTPDSSTYERSAYEPSASEPSAYETRAHEPSATASSSEPAAPQSLSPDPVNDVGSSGSSLADSLVQEVGGELDDLEREYRTARSAIADDDLDRRAQVQRLLSGGSDRNELVLEVVSLRSDQSRLSDELAARDEHVKSLRQQLGDLEQRLEHSSVSSVRVNELENEGRRLQRETEKMGALLDAREVERDEIAAKLRAVEVEKVQLRRETESLQSDNSSLDTERADMRKAVQKLEAELVRNRRDHEARRVQLEASAEERNEMSQKLAALQEDRAADLGRINELEALIERRDNEINHLKKSAARNEAEIDRIGDAATELELRTAERDKLRRRVESLESELTAQTTEAGASKKALELLAARTTERDELEKRVIELERDLVKFTALASTGEDTVSQLQQRTTERDGLEQKVVALEAELARERMQTAEWRETADLVATTTAERDKLRRRVSILEADLDAATAVLPTRSAELETIERIQSERAQLASRVEDAASSMRSGDDELMRRIAALEQQIAEQGARALPDGPERTQAGTTAASAAFDEAMKSAAEMRASLERAAGLLDGDSAAQPEVARPSVGAFGSETAADNRFPPLRKSTDSDDSLSRAELDQREPLWALSGSGNDSAASALGASGTDASDELAEGDEDGPSDQVYTMYRETLKNLESDDAPPPEEDESGDARSSDSAALASVLFSRGGSGDAIPGVDLAAAPPPNTPPLTQVGPPPGSAPPLSPDTPFAAPRPAADAGDRTRPGQRVDGPPGQGGSRPKDGNRQGRQRSRRRRTTASTSSIEAADALLSQGSHLLIDGDGVVAQTRFPHRFLDAIEGIAKARGMNVELVFDSSKVEPNPSLSTRDHVQVRFAQGVDVGDVITRLLDTIPASAATIVATDDAKLKNEARKLQADVIDMGQITGVASR